jgi:hypothetical protein
MADRNWVLNDVSPLSFAFEFEPFVPPPAWSASWYGGPYSMVFDLEGPPPPTFGLAHHKFMKPGFFGPKQ